MATSRKRPSPTDHFGFYSAITGVHMSRSMMLDELTLLLKGTRADASREAIRKAVVEENLLGKPTASSREKTYAFLQQGYTLDSTKVLWRVMRQFFEIEPEALPLMALVLVYSRDLQLRKGFELITSLKAGEQMARVRMEATIEKAFPDRYSKVMKESLAQHMNATWTATGHLVGRAVKHRSRPKPHWLATTYAMFVGYLAGVRGQVLLDSVYARLVGVDPLTAADHLSIGSAHGLLRFRNAGGVVETDFSTLLQPSEQLMLHGAH